MNKKESNNLNYSISSSLGLGWYTGSKTKFNTKEN